MAQSRLVAGCFCETPNVYKGFRWVQPATKQLLSFQDSTNILMAVPDGFSKLGLVYYQVAQSSDAVGWFQPYPLRDGVVHLHSGLLEILHTFQRVLHIIA